MCAKLTNEEFIRRVSEQNKGLIIRGNYVNTTTGVETECERGHIWFPKPCNLMYNKSGCPYCSCKKAWIGETDLWTTRPDVAKLLKNPEDGYKYMKGSSKKVDFVCPDCKAINNKEICMVCWYGFVCQKCSDGISYPNKFGRAFLEQVCGDDFQCEWQPDWAKPYFYDTYFEYNGKEYIVEMDGWFHYQDSPYARCSLEEQKSADATKDKLAMNHNINVIRIDCLKSDCNYIKNNILNSQLSEIFDLSEINWELCYAKAQKNLILEVCKLYNNGIHDLNEIKDVLHISLWATRKYVQLGASVNWCDYTISKSKQEGREKTMIPVNVVDNNGNIIHQFRGVRKCAEDMTDLYNINFNSPNIIKSCQTYKPYKGFNFRYA